MANKKKRSFRLSEVQAEVVMTALLYYLASTDPKHSNASPLIQSHRHEAETLYKKLAEYEFTTEE